MVPAKEKAPHFGETLETVAYDGAGGWLLFSRLEPLIYGPKYGTEDTVGVGITSNGNVYFTLNGVLLPLVETKLTGEHRIAI